MKAKLRKELRAKRRFLVPAQYALRSRRAASAVTRLAAFKAGARVAAYLPFDREADTAALSSPVGQDAARRLRHLDTAWRPSSEPSMDRATLVRPHCRPPRGCRRP